MTRYITFRDVDFNGNLQYCILQRDFPHFIAVTSEIPITHIVEPLPITGYNLFLVFQGTLRGISTIPAYANIIEEIKVILTDMGRWYYDERILSDPKKYKKWKINDTSSK